MKLYYAGPLFSLSELNFNKQLTVKIRNLGYDVFLPQEQSFNLENYDSVKAKNNAIFELDRKEMLSSDIFLFVLDGRIPDEGACVALGIMQAYKSMQNQSVQLIGLHTDRRVAFSDTALNPMIDSSLDMVFKSEEELINYLSK